MAATDVLRSQGCLRRSHFRNTHHNPNRKPNIRPRRRKENAAGVDPNRRDEIKNRSPDRAGPNRPCLPVKGQVKILKRGEPLPAVNKIEEKPLRKEVGIEKKVEYVVCYDAELSLGSTGRLGPEPDIVQRQIRVSDFYGVTAPFVDSPDPSSLPIPAGLTKKEKKIELSKKENKIDAATSDLLRLLREDAGAAACLPLKQKSPICQSKLYHLMTDHVLCVVSQGRSQSKHQIEASVDMAVADLVEKETSLQGDFVILKSKNYSMRTYRKMEGHKQRV